MHRGFRYRLYPTAAQHQQLAQACGVVRLVYNLALEQRRDFWRQHKAATGKSIAYVGQAAELTQLRAAYPWVAAVSQTAQQQALRDLDRAYLSFFAGRVGYPRPRKKGIDDAFRLQGRECRLTIVSGKWAMLKLPKICEVKLRLTRKPVGAVLNVTISRDALGWHASLICDLGEIEAPASRLPAVGIDRGIASTLTLATGEQLRLPETIERIERRKRRAQRVLARRRRGSRRHARQRRRIAKLQARSARIRRHWLHEQTTMLVRRFGTIVLEDLDIGSMTASARGTADAPGRNVRAKAGLNRAILAQGWHRLEAMLAFKLAARGGQLVKVPAQHTSQTCAGCGHIDPNSRKSQALFVCTHCGLTGNADINAAINIERRWNTALLRVEARHQPACEASTERWAA